MSSSLTLQLRQQQQQQQQHPLALHKQKHPLQKSQRHKPLHPQDKLATPANLPSPPNSSCGEDEGGMASKSLTDDSLLGIRRDSLPTHFSAMTLQALSSSLPENYTIDHSSPIPIHTPRRPSQTHLHPHSPSAASTAAAAATGGRTIRHRRGSENTRKSRLSESPAHRCEACGKVYKHPSCLAKHRWEHSEEWELTSKLLLTKHQQVQMLEAAAILVSMDAKKADKDQNGEEDMEASMDDEEVEDEAENDEDEDEEEEEEEEEGDAIKVDDGEEEDDDDISIDMDQDDTADMVQHPYLSLAANGSTPSKLPASFESSA